MNVDDVAPVAEIKGDGLVAVFTRQEELMQKYKRIDRAFLSRDIVAWPVDLDGYEAQCLLKDFAWRVTEELTESTQARQLHSHITSHEREEAVDALHFLVELAILAGVEPRHIASPASGLDYDTLDDMISAGPVLGGIETSAYLVIQEIGNAMNLLKNKPWKQTQMLTDIPRFHHYLVQSFVWMGRYFATLGMDRAEVLSFYFRKAAVNTFRQESKY